MIASTLYTISKTDARSRTMPPPPPHFLLIERERKIQLCSLLLTRRVKNQYLCLTYGNAQSIYTMSTG